MMQYGHLDVVAADCGKLDSNDHLHTGIVCGLPVGPAVGTSSEVLISECVHVQEWLCLYMQVDHGNYLGMISIRDVVCHPPWPFHSLLVHV